MPNKKISDLDSNGAPAGAAIVPVSQGLVNYGVALSSLPVSTAQLNALNLKAPLASPAFTGTVSGITAAMVSGLPAAQVQSNWTDASGMGAILNKPTIPAAQVQSDWTAVSGLGVIANKPTIPAAQVQSDWTAVSGLGVIANKPTIPAAQVQSDWNAGSGMGAILNKPAASLYTLPNATTSALGGVIVGAGLSVTAGTLSANVTTNYSLTKATTSALGGVIVGAGLSVTDGTLSADVTTAALALKAPLASPALTTPTLNNPVFTGIATGNGAPIPKALVGLDQVENTNDLNKVISTATTGALALKAPLASPIFTGIVTVAGGQIAFPATQLLSSNPNTLDDYERGLWTPTFIASITDPTVTYDGTITYGIYLKIGMMVFISGAVFLTAASGGSGNLRISGLPFSSRNGTTGGYGSLALGFRSGWTTTTPGTAYVQASTSYIPLWTTLVTAAITTANLSATSYIQFSGFYRTTV